MIVVILNSKYCQQHEHDVEEGDWVSDQKLPVFHVQTLKIKQKSFTYSKNLVAVAVDQKSMTPEATNPGGLLQKVRKVLT